MKVIQQYPTSQEKCVNEKQTNPNKTGPGADLAELQELLSAHGGTGAGLRHEL